MDKRILGQTMAMDELERQERRQEKEIVHFESSLEFLKSHNGFRPGKFHTFLGVASGGKSTLLRSLFADININNPLETIGGIFSEESIDEVKTEISKIDNEYFNPSNIVAISELDFDNSFPFSLKVMDQFIGDNHLSIFAWDNCTTSGLYEGRSAKDQFQVMRAVKQIIQKHDIPCIVFAHTDASINNSHHSLINMNDIRGGKGIVNLSEFFYIMQSFEIDKKIFPTLRLTKFRGHDVAERLYYLHYKPENFIFGGDHDLPWDDFINAYKNRNVLK